MHMVPHGVPMGMPGGSMPHGVPMGMPGGSMPMGGFGVPGMYPHARGMPQGFGHPMYHPHSPSPGPSPVPGSPIVTQSPRPMPSPRNRATVSPPGSGPRSTKSIAADSPRFRSSPPPAQAKGSIKLQQARAPGAEKDRVGGAGTARGVHGGSPRSSLFASQSPPSRGQASWLGASSDALISSPRRNSQERPEDRHANLPKQHQNKMPSQAPQPGPSQPVKQHQNKMPSPPTQGAQQQLRGPDRYQSVNQPPSKPGPLDILGFGRMPAISHSFTDGRGVHGWAVTSQSFTDGRAKDTTRGRPASNPQFNFQNAQPSDASNSATSPSKSLRLPDMLHIPFEPFSWSLFGPGGEAEKPEPNQRPSAPPAAEFDRPAKPMVGLGMLLTEKWLPKHSNVSSETFTISDVFAGIERKEKVWSVSALAPGFGAAESGKVCIDDIIIRIDGAYITGETSLEQIATLLRGPVGTSVKLSVERDQAAVSDSISMYSTNMSVMSTSSTFEGRKPNTVFRILRTQGTSLPSANIHRM